ncbi:unnamed protein product [Oikopleura dioica]|uniref:Uncharacterized protein n=1 Tax=Oikopleura dioica TaxID=34765 RepID=E4X1W7_OIKDI|nr:unnamed protein product [Oikopleura dioica]
MRTVSPFCGENEIILWIKESCLTIDYDSLPDLLHTMNYLTSYIICQMREAHFISPPDMQPAVVFMLRSTENVVKSINSLIPPASMDRVIISLPSTKEFMILNGTELEDNETYKEFRDLAFYPSGILETLPKPFPMNNPQPNKEWDQLWKEIKDKTTEERRRTYCSSFVSETTLSEDQEINLKAFLDKGEINKHALLNLLKSGKNVSCDSAEKLRHWTLKPRPDLEESAITTTTEMGTRICLPGQCSYFLMWKDRRTITWRDYKISPRAEHKYFFKNIANESKNYLTEDDLSTLSSKEKAKGIDNTPPGIAEIAPKRLTVAENHIIGNLKLKRWINIELWNPIHSITRITDPNLHKIWEGLYREIMAKTKNILDHRNGNWENKIETLSLIAEYDGRCNKKSKELKTLLMKGGKELESEMLDWITSSTKLMRKFIENKKETEHKNFLINQLKKGASCFSIVQNVPRMERCTPFSWHPTSQSLYSPRVEIFNRIYWIISNLIPRNERIWSKLTNYKQGAESLCRKPKSIFVCPKDNDVCLGKVVGWFTTNMQDTKNYCESSCKSLLQPLKEKIDPPAKKRKRNNSGSPEHIQSPGNKTETKLEHDSLESLPAMTSLLETSSIKSEPESPTCNLGSNSDTDSVNMENSQNSTDSSSLEMITIRGPKTPMNKGEQNKQ